MAYTLVDVDSAGARGRDRGHRARINGVLAVRYLPRGPHEPMSSDRAQAPARRDRPHRRRASLAAAERARRGSRARSARSRAGRRPIVPSARRRSCAALQAAQSGAAAGESASCAVFREIMSACRALEQAITVAYLGPAGHLQRAGGAASISARRSRAQPPRLDRRSVPQRRVGRRRSSAWCRWRIPPTARSAARSTCCCTTPLQDLRRGRCCGSIRI